MKIKNKLENIKLIDKLHLNRFPEELFNIDETEKIKLFLEKYPVKYYAVRSKDIVGSKLGNYKVPMANVLEYTKKFKLFTINVSSYNYSDNLILAGDAMIDNDCNIWIVASKSEYPEKQAQNNPDYNFNLSIFDKKVKDIPGINILIDYIYKHELLNIIVEFSIFNIEVGINNEKIIIWEIRTDY